jgi:hypothetical protein
MVEFGVALGLVRLSSGFSKIMINPSEVSSRFILLNEADILYSSFLFLLCGGWTSYYLFNF